MKNLTEAISDLKTNTVGKYQVDIKEKDVEIMLLKDIIKSTKSAMRIKDQEIKKLSLQIQKLKVIKESKEKKIENEKSLQVLNEFDIEEGINNLILENKEFMQQEAERKKKKTNSFSLENNVFEDNNISYGQNVTIDFPAKSILNKNLIRNSAKVLPNEIFHNLSEDENNGSKNIVII